MNILKNIGKFILMLLVTITVIAFALGSSAALGFAYMAHTGKQQVDVDNEGNPVIENKKQKEKQIDKLIGVLTKCYIHGCCVHTIDKSGRIIKHYGKGMKGYDIMDINSMSERLKKGYQLYQVNDCVCVEVYEQHMCIVGSNGKTKVTEE